MFTSSHGRSRRGAGRASAATSAATSSDLAGSGHNRRIGAEPTGGRLAGDGRPRPPGPTTTWRTPTPSRTGRTGRAGCEPRCSAPTTAWCPPRASSWAWPEPGPSYAAVRTAGIAGLAAGAMSMAVGEYVSVASQRDIEEADLRIERQALEEHPVAELRELAQIWEARGLEPELAEEVARQLTEKDALAAHARDELGLTEVTAARPVQAAADVAGGVHPRRARAAGGVPRRTRTTAARAVVVAAAVVALVAPRVAGRRRSAAASRLRAMARVGVGGAAAMGVTLLIGELTGAALGLIRLAGLGVARRVARARTQGVHDDDRRAGADARPSATEAATRTAYRTCPLCEASCGLEITLRPTPAAARRSCASAATATTCSATATSAPRAPPSSSSTRTPTGCAARS